MPFVRITRARPAGLESLPSELEGLHGLIQSSFGCPPHVLRIMLHDATAIFPDPQVSVIDIRAQRRPDRTPEMLKGVVAAIDEFLLAKGREDLGIASAKVRIELCDA